MDIGDYIGAYRLDALLGDGSQAEVWRATWQGPGSYERPVALRWMPGADAEGVRRERRLGGLLKHVNLVEVFEVGADDTGVWVAQELIEGGTLYDVVRERPLSIRAASELGHSLANALAHLHQQGLLHRDVTPANVLMARDGTPKLSDLGLALWIDEADSVDQSGTPGFRSPEQLRCERLDGRSDVWSLGSVIFLCATGRPLEALVCEDRGRLLAELERSLGVHPPLVQALMKCLEPAVSDRWTASEASAGWAAVVDAPGRGLVEMMGVQVSATPEKLSLGNLPAPTEGWVGREALIDEAQERLEGKCAVLTLHGPGGSGKTQFAIRLLTQHEAPGGCWWVDLAAIREPDGVLGAFADSLGIVLQEKDPFAHLGLVLSSRPDLFVLVDNAEHVLPAVVSMVGELLQVAPRVRWVVTSREELGLGVESVLQIEPMTSDEQRELFIQRARSLGWDGEEEVPLDPLLSELGGLPLAIELAAAQVAAFGFGALANAGDRSRLDDSLLHPGMSAALERSWDLLNAQERSGLCQLSVFRGDFELDAVEEVLLLVDTDIWVLDLLDSLLRKALLAQRGFCFRLYEPIRQFAREKCSKKLRFETEIRHGSHYASHPSASTSETQVDALRIRAQANVENHRAAWERAVERGDTNCALAIALPLADYHGTHGPWSREREIHDRTLAMEGGDPSRRLSLEVVSASALVRCGDFDAALQRLERLESSVGTVNEVWEGAACGAAYVRGVALMRQGRAEEALQLFDASSREGYSRGLWHTSTRLAIAAGAAATRLGRLDEADGMFRMASAAATKAGSPDLRLLCMGHWLAVLWMLERHEESKTMAAQALSLITPRSNPRHTAALYLNLALSNWSLDGVDRSFEYNLRAAEVSLVVGDYPQAGQAYLNLGELSIARGDLESASRYLNLAQPLSEQSGMRLLIGYGHLILARLARLQGHMDKAFLEINAARKDMENLEYPKCQALLWCEAAKVARGQARMDDARAMRDRSVNIMNQLSSSEAQEVREQLAGLDDLA